MTRTCCFGAMATATTKTTAGDGAVVRGGSEGQESVVGRSVGLWVTIPFSFCLDGEPSIRTKTRTPARHHRDAARGVDTRFA